MATFRKRNGLFQAQIRLTGHRPVSRSFKRKPDARKWAQAEEVRIRALSPAQRDAEEELRDITVAMALSRYADTVSPRKRSGPEEIRRIAFLKKSRLAPLLLKDVTPLEVEGWREEREQDVSSGTVLRDWALFEHMYNVARSQWGFPLENPFFRTKGGRPKANPPRERRLNHGEEARLLEACQRSRSWFLEPLVVLAIETAVRRRELLSIKWENIDFDTPVPLLNIPAAIAKTGQFRAVPLSVRAEKTLQKIPHKGERVFQGVTANAVNLAWQRARKRAGSPDLHFHDLRHEATSRYFEKELALMEVASITGHRTLEMLRRYTHLSPHTFGEKLRAA